MPPTYFGRSVNPVDNGALVNSKVTVVPPASMLAGDLVYLTGLVRDPAATAAFTISNCGGQDWATIGGTLKSGIGASLQRWWCRFTGTWAGNVLTANQASIETDASGWAAEANCNIARTSAGGAFDGTFALSLTAIASGNMNARTSPSGASGFSVTPGTRYTAMAHFKAATTGRTVRIRVSFHDSAGTNFVGYTATATDTTGGFTRAEVAPVAPLGAAYASVQVTVEGPPAAGEVHYVDGISFAVGGASGGTDWYLPTAIDPIINAGLSDAITGVMLVFRPGSAGTRWTLQDQDFALPSDVSGPPFDLSFPSQTVPDNDEVIITEWHDDILHTMALQTAGWTNPSGETQWRNTGGSDTVLSIAYKVQNAGTTGAVVNRADTAASMGATYAAFTERPLYPGIVATADTGGGYQNSSMRPVDYTQNGVWWACLYRSSGGIGFWFSTDRGQTWTENTSMKLDTSNEGYNPDYAVIFIDKDDYMHLAYAFYAGEHGYRVYYRRGTPDIPRTSYTWSAPNLPWNGFSNGQLVSDSYTITYDPGLDIVAFRDPTSGWHAMLTLQYFQGAFNPALCHISIAANGTITPDANFWGTGVANNSFNYYQSIDFRHTAGDAKLVQSATPTIYWAFSENGGGSSGFLMRVVYSGGVWDYPSEGTVYFENTQAVWNVSPVLYYDGTRIVVAYVGVNDNSLPRVTEKDEANTTSTSRTVTSPADDDMGSGLSIGYDNAGDIWMVISGGTSRDIKKSRYNRAGNSWGSWSTVAALTSGNQPAVSRRVSSTVAGAILPVLYSEATGVDVVYFDVVTADIVVGRKGWGIDMGLVAPPQSKSASDSAVAADTSSVVGPVTILRPTSSALYLGSTAFSAQPSVVTADKWQNISDQNDSTYVQGTGASYLRGRLATMTDPGFDTNHTLWMRGEGSSGTGSSYVHLYQGDPETGNEIAYIQAAEDTGPGPINQSRALTTGEAALLTNYADLWYLLERSGGTHAQVFYEIWLQVGV